MTCRCGESMIGVEVQGVYDGVLYFECPSCGERAHRFPEGDWRREKAERLWQDEQERRLCIDYSQHWQEVDPVTHQHNPFRKGTKQ